MPYAVFWLNCVFSPLLASICSFLLFSIAMRKRDLQIHNLAADQTCLGNQSEAFFAVNIGINQRKWHRVAFFVVTAYIIAAISPFNPILKNYPIWMLAVYIVSVCSYTAAVLNTIFGYIVICHDGLKYCSPYTLFKVKVIPLADIHAIELLNPVLHFHIGEGLRIKRASGRDVYLMTYGHSEVIKNKLGL